MLALVIACKLGLITGILLGAGLALARCSLRTALPAGNPLRGLQRSGLALAAVSAAASYCLLVMRLGGGWAPPVARMVLQSPSGQALILVIGGALLALLLPRLAPLGAALIVGSPAVVGHAPAQSALDGVVVGTHAAAAAWWTGGLLILAVANQLPDWRTAVLARFSTQALAVVFVLTLAGIWVVLALVGYSLSALGTPYGKVLLVKVSLASVALAFAAYNRLRLKSAVDNGRPGAVRRLHRNVLGELACIGLVAAATAVLTSSLSPPMAGH